MKIALVFHGLSEGKNEKGLSTSINIKSFKNIKSRLIKNCDIYFHTWDSSNKKKIIDMLKPKKFIFENSNNFKNRIKNNINNICNSINKDIGNFIPNNQYLFSFYSRFYSLYKSVSLITNINSYDMIIISRFDLYLLKKLNILKYNKKNILYVNKFHGEEYLTGNNMVCLDGIQNNFNKNILLYGVMDYFFMGSPSIILKFSKLYLKLDEYFKKSSDFYKNKWARTFSGHSICMYHIKKNKINLEYTEFIENIHFNLIRDNIISESTILCKCNILIKNKKYQKAIDIINNSSINSANLYNQVGYIYYLYLKNIKMAILYYSKSLNTTINKNALNSLIKIYYNLANIKETKKYCSIYIKNFYSPIIEKLYNSL